MATTHSSVKQPVAGFMDDGKRYVVRDVHYLDEADSHLFNDTLFLHMNMRGRCESKFVQPGDTQYAEPLRTFYIRDEDTGDIWSAPFDPVQREPESFEFSAGASDLRWRITTAGIEVQLRLVVPRDEPVELWTLTVANQSRRKRRLSVYPYFPIGEVGGIAQIGRFDAGLGGVTIDYFPYYVRIEDYYKMARRRNVIFLAGDRKPLAGETCRREFLGGRGLHDPAALHLRKLANGQARSEDAVAALQFSLGLAPQESTTINLAFGSAHDHAETKRLVRFYLSPGGVERALKKVLAYQKSISPAVRIETPDADFNHFINHWLPHQTHFCGGLSRMAGEPCVRNAFQDAMGATFNLPERARHWHVTVLGHHNADGYMPHGAALAEGVTRIAINSIPHRDMNVWTPITLGFYVKETGDMGILKERVGFKDCREKATVYEHVCRGLEWQLRDRTARKLCRIGEGDWDDPLNMAGWKNKGESVWLTEALAMALDTWAEVGERMGDAKRAARFRKEAEVSRRVVNELAWDGKWYARGTTDAGRWFGTHQDKEGKVFLNAQSWALICGAAKSPGRVRALMQAVERHLMTPSGPMTMAPAFTHMHEDIGKITQKTPGTDENGSVYCHAASFYAYGLYQARRPEEAFHVLRTLLTGAGSNPVARSRQLPLYLPNHFRGLAANKTAGRSSFRWGTGTAAWYYRIAVTQLLGVRGEFDGLRMDPQLPGQWNRAKVWRKFRGASFNISIQKSVRVKKIEVRLDGELLKSNLIPLQEPGTGHSVEVFIPK